MKLYKDSFWNFLGFAVPSLIALPSIGVLARLLGVEEFGVFILVFAVVGYAGIFDAGLTRAVIRDVSYHRDSPSRVLAIIGSSAYAVSILGILASILLILFSDHLLVLLSIPESLNNEFRLAIYWLAATIPCFLLGLIFSAYFDGIQSFFLANIQKVINNTILAITPLLFTWLLGGLSSAVMGLFIGRLLGLVVSIVFLRICKPEGRLTFDSGVLKELMSYGGWLTITNIVSPLMVFFDRFIVSNMLGAQSVAFYASPSEAVTRLSRIPGSIARALFPSLAKSDRSNAEAEERHALKAITILSVLIAVPIIIFSEFIMVLWMGENYAGTPATVLSILTIGFVFNSMAQVPFSSIQAKGYSKKAAFVHLSEVVPYMLILVTLITSYGIIGAAIAWVLRVAIDFFIFYYLSKNIASK